MSKHTPGPWGRHRVGYNGSRYYIMSARRGGDFVIAEVPTDRNYKHQALANAYLIAAAPDMLAALKAVVAVADRSTVEFDAARAALAKAEGRA